MEPCWTFIKCHPYPSYETMLKYTDTGLFDAFEYTQELHNQLQPVYSPIGKNTYKVYGRKLGEYLNNMGGTPTMRMGMNVLETVIDSFPQDGIGSGATAKVLATILLSSSWNDVGDWKD